MIFALLVSSLISNADMGNAVGATLSALQQTGSYRPAKNEIFGKCEIEGTGDVSLPAPCNGVEVILLKSDKEVARTRADSSGEFKFGPLTGGIYDINIESKKFKLAKPIQKLATGQAYAVKLK